jgi:hypothetical protein
MSTRALYTFKAGPGHEWEMDWNVYKHHDGYPTGAADAILHALPRAWPLPRYESDEFAAAFIGGNKHLPDPKYPTSQGGGVRLMPQGDPKEVAGKYCSDIQYRYVVEQEAKAPHDLIVTAYAFRDYNGVADTKLFAARIGDFAKHAKAWEKKVNN